jgi:hypothetical protein
MTGKLDRRTGADSEAFLSCNPRTAASLTPGERLAEIGEILAAGVVRLRARKSSHFCAQHGEISVDCAAHQSGHAATRED